MSRFELYEKIEIYKQKFGENPINIHQVNDDKLELYLNLLDYAIKFDEKIDDKSLVSITDTENEIL